jgi:hypothetical protein
MCALPPRLERQTDMLDLDVHGAPGASDGGLYDDALAYVHLLVFFSTSLNTRLLRVFNLLQQSSLCTCIFDTH